MPEQSGSATALWGLFLAGALSVGVVVVALGAALVIAQRRRRALQLTYAQRLLAAQEEERAHLAREVHDDALQRVAMIRQELESLRRSGQDLSQPDSAHRLDAITAEVQDLGVKLRAVAHELHPSLIGDVGLMRALTGLAADFRRTDALHVELALPEEEIVLPPAAALALYRIAQEALRNVARHARVMRAELSIAVKDGHVVLTVKDAGAGFVTDNGGARTGLGLISMKERAAIARGTVAVHSSPGRGTAVQASVPRSR